MPNSFVDYYNDQKRYFDKLSVVRAACDKYIKARNKWLSGKVPAYRGGWKNLNLFCSPDKTRANVSAMELILKDIDLYLDQENSVGGTASYAALLRKIRSNLNRFATDGHGRELLTIFLAEASADHEKWKTSVKAPEDLSDFLGEIGSCRINHFSIFELISFNSRGHVILMKKPRGGSMVLKQIYAKSNFNVKVDLKQIVRNEAACFAAAYKKFHCDDGFYDENPTGYIAGLTNNLNPQQNHFVPERVAASFVMPTVEGIRMDEYLFTQHSESALLQLFYNLFHALAELHFQVKIAHNNIQPKNILVTSQLNILFTGYSAAGAAEKNGIRHDVVNMVCSIIEKDIKRKDIFLERYVEEYFESAKIMAFFEPWVDKYFFSIWEIQSEVIKRIRNENIKRRIKSTGIQSDSNHYF
ncbi:hypothetical protein P0136_13240 [Lentisphaerota bacterium ZTH]|nr:hypothetical protein JYG24_09245 [Lentisphaerota bacterium]WET06323.1 hypothetical protein P0136_13240 [Lentisphaerota bacterium ZTH]